MLGLDNVRNVGWADKKNFCTEEKHKWMKLCGFRAKVRNMGVPFSLGVRRTCRYLESER